MKTAKELGEMIIQLNLDIQKEYQSESQGWKLRVTKLKNKIQFLRTCKLCVESSPDEKYLKSERQRLENRINLFMDGYTPLDPAKFIKGEVSKHRNRYEQEMGIPYIRTQLQTLYFILN